MNKLDAALVARITYIAQQAKANGYEDVCAWIGKHLAFEIREDRPKRRRGVEVVLARTNRKVKLDAARVKQLMRDGE